MKSNNRETGKLIRSRRVFLGMTQSELSRDLKWKCINAQQISNIEKGKCQLPIKHIVVMAKSLRVDPIEIVTAMKIDYSEGIYNETMRQALDKNNHFLL